MQIKYQPYPPEYDHEPPLDQGCAYCPCSHGEEMNCDECPECHHSRESEQ